MSEHEFEILLMGYLDGELSDADRARVEEALEKEPDLRRELEEMRRLKEITTGLGIDDKTDTELEAFWGGVYNQLERKTGWMLLLAGFLGLVAIGAQLFFTSPDTHWMIKAGAGCCAAGSVLLIFSCWRERRRVLPHDRYHKEVHR